MDEMALTPAESKAAYEEIKNYVKEKTNLQVSNLYIAQIKRKYRIIERINYNLPNRIFPDNPNVHRRKKKRSGI